jgi:hypothetical protein
MKVRYPAVLLTPESNSYDHIEIMYIATREREQFDNVTNYDETGDRITFEYSATVDDNRIQVSVPERMVKIEKWNDDIHDGGEDNIHDGGEDNIHDGGEDDVQ